MLRKAGYAALAALCFGVAVAAFVLAGPGRQHTLDTALFFAARSGNETGAGAAKLLGGDVNARDLTGTPLIMLVAAADEHAMIAWLLANGAAVDAADAEGNTALSAAAGMGATRSAELLLAAGAATEPKTYGHSPLQLAIWGRHFGVAKAILRAGGSTSRIDGSFAATSLLDAIDAGDHETIALLLEKGADPNAADRFGWNPLRKAAFLGRLDVARLLRAHGAVLEARDNDGWTPLLLAAAAGQVTMTTYLLAEGADPNGRANDGRTPLMKAATLADSRLAALLLTHGADAALADAAGKTAGAYADASGRPETAALLRRAAGVPPLHGRGR